MSAQSIAVLVNYASVALGVMSALLWTRSATVRVQSTREDGTYWDGHVVDDGNDFYATARVQAKWNRWAAGMAAAAALAQAAANLIK
ncbi:hypothetical protein Q3O98_11410 [Ralstonia pseudosolanacearum]|uniref:hypothetical protein n=1 Tax=Ralstonia pseudosolanacearum TaxID=1310165 RepID=UPI0026744648|nr:hypothetical protein [Ralstonia pseudosolanacearum]MDO3617316.1 hypothetical protein [Ralstonia pseudosolanacearum]MDO3621706.1 hypothetical protein [Ralstonia pseudosolanacearum]